MKQASFKLGETINKEIFVEKNKNNIGIDVGDKTTNKTIDKSMKINNDKNTITSRQQKKRVENIYYFD